MDGLDDFILFNLIEDAREESERENNNGNYNSFGLSWESDASNDNDEE